MAEAPSATAATPLASQNGSITLSSYNATAVEKSPLLGCPGRLIDITRAASRADSSDSDDVSFDGGEHKTTWWQTYIHLLKGYIGPGCLSLPWAVSQLGIPLGCVAIAGMAYWSSYNCWTVVKLKRYVERTASPILPMVDDGATSDAPSTATVNTNITYPDLGEWAFGKQFSSYVSACVCVQQLAICTVFFSFIGENILAVLERFVAAGSILDSHTAVLTLALPAVLSLSFMPNLKSLSPVMVAGTVLMLVGFAFLGAIGWKEWDDRPDETPTMNLPQIPLAVCAILYSYEGICLVLPVESAMKEPQHFKSAFVWSMMSVAFILAAVASLSVYVFGDVNNGSITAFLLNAYRDDPSITLWLMLANTAVSLSILLTFPLQLFPALELMGPWLSRHLPFLKAKAIPNDVAEDSDLAEFEPLPPIGEHEEASLGSIPAQHDYGDYGMETNDEAKADVEDDDLSRTMVSSVTSMFPEMTMPGDSPLLRILLVLLTYSVAVVVPNVQTLISLAGAVAGSSVALLIPPVLELAWIQQLQKDSKDDQSCIDRYLLPKIKNWLLLSFGAVFMLIGSVASITDIVRIYSGAVASD